METNLFTLLSLIIVIAVLLSALMKIMRQPLVIGYILTGIIVGPSFLDLIKDKAPFEAFSSIGIALLLFIIGLGLSTTVIKRLGKVVLAAATAQIILTTGLGYTFGLWLGLNHIEALVTGLCLAFSSTIIIIKLLSDKREQNRLYAQVSIGILLIQDVVASIALVLLAAGKQGNISAFSIGWLVFKGALICGILMFVSSRLLPKITKFVAGSQEFLFLAALAWGFGIASLFELAGFSIEVGALFAGVSLASLPYAQEIAARLKPLRDFFVVVFFIALGEGLMLNNIGAALWPALVLSAVVILLKPLVVLISMGILGYTKRTSFKAAVSLSQISEFSLVFVVLAASNGLVSNQLGEIITIVAIITIALSTYLMKYDDEVFLKLEKSLRLFERRTVADEHQQLETYPIILFGYHKGGDEFIKSFNALRKKFVVVDYDPEIIESLEHKNINTVYGDITDLEMLQELRLDKTKLVVSTIADHPTNCQLIKYITAINNKAIIICHSESYNRAAELYNLGATYVMIPHLLGSERIGSFIKHAGLNKQEFDHYRDKHLLAIGKHIEQ